MNILITGAGGFVGKNLCSALKNLRDNKDRTRKNLCIDEIMEYDLSSDQEELVHFCKKADFVFHLAGVNRPQNDAEFAEGNCRFTETLLMHLQKAKNTCPVMLSSSLQASLVGRYDAPYGRSKLQAENLVRAHGEKTGAATFIFRFPNLFGKWCRPNYNSVVATFCHNVAHDLPLTIHDENTALTLLYIDDLVEAMLDLLEGRVRRVFYDALTPVEEENGPFCYVKKTHTATLSEIAALLNSFAAVPKTLQIPALPENSFEKKLYSTYLSYLPKEKIAFDLNAHEDARGSFTEILKPYAGGQFSVNVSKPGVTKGEHWHHTKWEFFVVVSGTALIQMRKLDSDEVLEFTVNGAHPKAVCMLPGYTHNLTNLSNTEDLVTVMWANEPFDETHPDTFFENVE